MTSYQIEVANAFAITCVSCDARHIDLKIVGCTSERGIDTFQVEMHNRKNGHIDRRDFIMRAGSFVAK